MLVAQKNRIFMNLVHMKISRSFIARPTRQSAILEVVRPSEEKFSREYLKLRFERPNFEEEDAMKIAQLAKEKEIRDNFFKPSNDRNPFNFVPVKMSSNVLIPEIPFHTTQPLVTFVLPKTENLNVAKGIRRKIPVSFKKMRVPVGLSKKKHVLDFLDSMQSSKRKSSQYIVKALIQVINHAKQQNLDELRLFVKKITLGKFRRINRMRYHAKMKHGIMKRDSTQLSIELEEKPLEDFFKEMIKGKFPQSFGNLIKTKMVNEGTDYETLLKYQPMITPKGRQQQRLMFKRRVQAKYMELRAKGYRFNRTFIENQMLNEFVKEYVQKYESSVSTGSQERLSQRRRLFEENEKA